MTNGESPILNAFLRRGHLFLLPADARNAGWRDVASSSINQAPLASRRRSQIPGLKQAWGPPGVMQRARCQWRSARSCTGTWRCRTIKLGGMTPSRVYSLVSLPHLRSQAAMLRFEKISGSQRMGGTLYPEGNGESIWARSWVKSEHPHRYSGNGASAGATATPDDQIGRSPDLHGARHRNALSGAGIHLWM